MRPVIRVTLVLSLCSGVAACAKEEAASPSTDAGQASETGTGAGADASADVNSLPDIPPPGPDTPPDVPASPDVTDAGADVATGHATTGLRAYVIAASDTADLAGGDMASARPGDVVLANDTVRFVIRGGKTSFYLQGLGGGGLIDASRGRDGAPPSPQDDLLQEMLPLASLSSLGEGTIVVTADGSDGKVAEVTVTAEAIPEPLIASWVPIIETIGPLVQRYRLGPADTHLELTLEVPAQDTPDATVVLGDGIFVGGHARLVNPAIGGFLASEGPHASYALVADKPLNPSTVDTVTIVLGPSAPAPLAWKRWLVVGDGSLSSVVDQAIALRGLFAGEVHGVLDDVTAAVEVSAYDKDQKLVTRYRPDKTGKFGGKLPEGLFTLVAEGPGRAPGAPVTVDMVQGMKKDDLVLSVKPRATLSVTVDGPTRLTLLLTSGDKETVPVPPGTTELPIAPGSYKLIAARGFEYEIAETTLDFGPGETKTWAPTLTRSVETPGWIAADFHLHSEWSTDSSVPLRDRVLACAAEGVEYAVSTDHDVVTDYGDFVLPSLQGRIVVGIGCETSTAEFGHINGWPHVKDPSRPGHGAPVWFSKDFPEVLASIRDGNPNRVIQVNHPRSGTNGFLDRVGYKAAKPDPKLLDLFTFNAMEIYNATGDGEFNEQIVDWLSMVKANKKIAATGVSDSHSIGALCGHPRTYVEVKDDDPKTAKGPDIDQGVLAQRTLMTSGPFLVLTAGAAAGTVHVKVAGPSWMPIETITLYADGVAETPVTIPAFSGNVVRLDSDLPITATNPAFVVAVVRADKSAAPMLRAKVTAVSPVLWLKK